MKLKKKLNKLVRISDGLQAVSRFVRTSEFMADHISPKNRLSHHLTYLKEVEQAILFGDTRQALYNLENTCCLLQNMMSEAYAWDRTAFCTATWSIPKRIKYLEVETLVLKDWVELSGFREKNLKRKR